MIENKEKLIAAFILPAVCFGDCGLHKSPESRSKQQKVLEAYLNGQGEFSQIEIEKYQPTLAEVLKTNNPRDYFYLDHYETVREEIEKTLGISFEEAITNSNLPKAKIHAQRCPVRFYRIIQDQEGISGEAVRVEELTREKSKLISLRKGLEIPAPGNIISSHWGQMIEVVDEYYQLDRAIQLMQEYYSNLEKILKKR